MTITVKIWAEILPADVADINFSWRKICLQGTDFNAGWIGFCDVQKIIEKESVEAAEIKKVVTVEEAEAAT